MILLTETDQKLSLSPDTAGDLHVSVSFVDIDSTVNSFTPDSQEELLAAASPADILAEPGANVKRQVKAISIVNAHPKLWNRVRVRKNVGANVRQLSPTFFLRPRSSAQFADRLGWKILTDQHPGCCSSPPHNEAGYTGSANSHSPVQGEAKIFSMGFAPSAVQSVRLQPRVNTIPSSVVWAEAFLLAGGHRASDAETYARIIGYLDVSALIVVTGGQNYVVTPTIPIKPGDRIWGGVAMLSTGANVQWRTAAFFVPDDLGLSEFRVATIGRPSLSLGKTVVMAHPGSGSISMARSWVR